MVKPTTMTEALGVDPTTVYSSDPVKFAKQMGLKLYDRQEELLQSVANNPQTSVVGCNGSGKDYTVGAALIPWWLHTHEEAEVVVMAPTHRQVQDIVFRELRASIASSQIPLTGRVFKTSRYEADDYGGIHKLAIGFATNDPYNIQGFHSANSLVIISEAHNIEESHIEAMNRLLPNRILMTGNPFSSSGTFYGSHHDKSDHWSTLTIPASDTPNIKGKGKVIPGLVSQQDLDRLADTWGVTDPLYLATVECQWLDVSEDVLIPLSLLKHAQELAKTAIQVPEGRPTLACDVARYGSDKTVIYELWPAQDDDSPGLFLSRLNWVTQGQDLMTTTGKLRLARAQLNASGVLVDDAGVGGGVVDRLRELGDSVMAFNFGARSSEPLKYADLGTEAWYNVLGMLQRGELAIGDDPTLIAQLVSRRRKILSSGVIKLESKDEMKKRGLKSPDHADAFVMVCYGAHAGGGGVQVWF